MPLKKSSELRAQEHVNSRQFHIKFNGTAETCPYKFVENPIDMILLPSYRSPTL